MISLNKYVLNESDWDVVMMMILVQFDGLFMELSVFLVPRFNDSLQQMELK